MEPAAQGHMSAFKEKNINNISGINMSGNNFVSSEVFWALFMLLLIKIKINVTVHGRIKSCIPANIYVKNNFIRYGWKKHITFLLVFLGI